MEVCGISVEVRMDSWIGLLVDKLKVDQMHQEIKKKKKEFFIYCYVSVCFACIHVCAPHAVSMEARKGHIFWNCGFRWL